MTDPMRFVKVAYPAIARAQAMLGSEGVTAPPQRA